MNYKVEKFLQKIFLIQVLVGGRSRTGEPWVVGPSSYPLVYDVLVERIISELPDELRGRRILENIPSPCRV
jgi:hypothetical protein